MALGYDDEQARKEAKRCLQCDLRLNLKSNPSPAERIVVFDKEHVKEIPETEGVYQLYDEEHNVLVIKGTVNLRESLLEELEENSKATGIDYEEEKMYSQRESELIQAYLQEHGEISGGGDDDLF